MNFKELQKIVKFARKQGIIRLKMADCELELSQSAISPTKITRTIKTDNKDVESKSQYSDEQILFWSTQPIDPGSHNA